MGNDSILIEFWYFAMHVIGMNGVSLGAATENIEFELIKKETGIPQYLRLPLMEWYLLICIRNFIECDVRVRLP